MKTAIIISLVLMLSLVSATLPDITHIHTTPTEVTRPVHSFGGSSGSGHIKSEKSTSGGFIVPWVMKNGVCVKEDLYSNPFTIGKDSRFTLPFRLVKVNEDGSRTIQRIVSGKYGVGYDFINKKVELKPKC